MTDSLKRPLAIAAVAGALALGSSIAAAQTGPEMQPEMQPDPETQPGPDVIPQHQFTPEQIEAFAEAAREVTALQQHYNAELEQAEDADEMARLHEEAQDEMVGVVEDSGLSPDEYNAILQAANEDPQLYAQIVALMQGVQ